MMQSSSLIIPSSLPLHPFSSSKTRCINGRRSSRARILMMARRRERDFGGRMVDENMIVLRKRIQEMKMMERNYEAPSDWMEWEKHYYTSYDSMVCEALGVLQTVFMNLRPSFALGILAFLALSLPLSASLLLYHLLQLGHLVLHLN